MEGKLCIVTGATGGIGRVTARTVAETVGDGFGVVPGHRRIREQPGEKPGAHAGEFVQVQGAGGPGPRARIRP